MIIFLLVCVVVGNIDGLFVGAIVRETVTGDKVGTSDKKKVGEKVGISDG